MLSDPRDGALLAYLQHSNCFSVSLVFGALGWRVGSPDLGNLCVLMEGRYRKGQRSSCFISLEITALPWASFQHANLLPVRQATGILK